MIDRRRRRGGCVVGLLACALLPALAACSSEGTTGSAATARPLTDAEASLLANVLFDNHDAGGATFQLAIQLSPGATISLQGEIDWVDHRGHASVSSTGTEGGIQEVYWNDSVVLERRDGLNAVLGQAGHPGITFVARPPDIAGRDLDQALSIVTGLASEQRDNPLLIRQTEGAEFVRDDRVRDTEAVVLRYGPFTTYWLAADDGRMLRFEGNNGPGTRPVVFDVFGFGEQTIPGPPAEQVLDAAAVQDLYDGMVGDPATAG